MCEPITAATIIGGAITAGSKIAGGIAEANNQVAQGKEALRQSHRNAAIAEIAAGDAIARGEKQVALARIQTSQLISKQQLAYVGSGVDATVGTAAQTALSTATLGELDAATIRLNAAREAFGYRSERNEILAQGRAGILTSQNNATAALLGGFLSGASDVANAGVNVIRNRGGK